MEKRLLFIRSGGNFGNEKRGCGKTMIEILIFFALFISAVFIVGSGNNGLMSPEEGERWFDDNFKIDEEGRKLRKNNDKDY